MTRAVDLMSHPVPESSMDDATPISTPLPSNSEEASKDTSETTQSSITEFSSSPKRDAPSTDGILAFSAPQPAAAAAATTTTTITPSPAWGSASSWGVKCASTVPSAFSTRTVRAHAVCAATCGIPKEYS
ncbi:hypothetical protein NEOLEDRAFT_892720 [Neolentinus lepideus HHB14362 ss-1]|uniref:Uncharacterized protein n=1 Tax=Neolentinus lepideus HHB14362 ss-1 TaxID=1314782 RepID=A0A165NTX4_9AGAM|nr:hypothetical protein NEOLEDRAFT_892720 [Neolentinus lepideus HHB14362 ss-1]